MKSWTKLEPLLINEKIREQGYYNRTSKENRAKDLPLFKAQSAYKSPLHRLSNSSIDLYSTKLQIHDRRQNKSKSKNKEKRNLNKDLKTMKIKIERYTTLNPKDNISLTNKSIERIKLRRKMYKLKQHRSNSKSPNEAQANDSFSHSKRSQIMMKNYR